jgi:hypothetical protein
MDKHLISTIIEPSYLGARTGQIRTEHDNPGGGIRKFLATGLESVLKKLEVTTTTVTPLLILDFILNNEWFRFEVYGRREGGRDGMVGSFAFGNETLVTVNERERRLLYLPFADVTEGLTAHRGLLRCL